MQATLEYIVKKFNLDLSQPQPIQISSVGRDGLAKIFAELNFNKGAEIGVDRGAFSEILCEANSKLHLYSINSWSITSIINPAERTERTRKRIDQHYRDAKQKLSAYNCTVIRKESLSTVNVFDDNSLDFVYIDSNHSFAEVANDIYRWEKKVKVGGIVSGHDYQHFSPSKDNHVKHVVDAYIQAFEIFPYFELGQDRYHSWFWVKEK